MCLYKTHRFPKISVKPIKVYKILHEVYSFEKRRIFFRTPFRGTEVKVGETIKARRWWFMGIFRNIIEGEGVHAYTDKWKANFEAEIPPFTPYWYGEDNEIAASRMKIIREL